MYMTSASEPNPSSLPPKRPIAMTEKSRDSSSGGTTTRLTARSVAWIVTSVIVVSASCQLLDGHCADDRRHRDTQQFTPTQGTHRAHRVVDRRVPGLDGARLLLQRDTRARPQLSLIVEPGGGLRESTP